MSIQELNHHFVRHIITTALAPILILFGTDASANQFEAYERYVPDAVRIVSTDDFVYQGRSFTQINYLDTNNVVTQRYIDKTTDNISDSLPNDSTPVNSAPRMSEAIETILSLDDSKSDNTYKIVIFLKHESKDTPLLSPVGTKNQNVKQRVKQEIKLLEKYLKEAEKDRRKLANKLLEKYEIDISTIEVDPLNSRKIIASVDWKTLRKLSSDRVDIETIDIWRESSPTMAEAMAESRADTNHYNWMDGSGARVSVMESANGATAGCAPAGTATNYENLTGIDGEHGERVVGIVSDLAPNSYINCTFTNFNWDFIAIYNMQPHIINGSFSYLTHDPTTLLPINTMYDVPYPSVAREFDELVWDSNALVVASAGNGSQTLTQFSPSARGPGPLGVGSYGDNGNISGFSMFAEFLGHQKPELSAIGENVAVAGLGNANGTSFSAPHVTGVLAGLVGEYEEYRFRPALLKALAISGATRPIAGGLGLDSNGYGGIDASSFHNAQQATHAAWETLGAWWYIAALTEYELGMGTQYIDDDEIRLEATVPPGDSGGRARVVLSYAKVPSVIWANRNAARPIGTDLNISVYGPNGQFLGGSYDWSDPVEVFEFDMAGPGTYRIIINRAWERDLNYNTLGDGSPALRVGVAFNWDL